MTPQTCSPQTSCYHQLNPASPNHNVNPQYFHDINYYTIINSMKKILSVLNVTVYHIRSLENSCDSGDTKLMPLFPVLVDQHEHCTLHKNENEALHISQHYLFIMHTFKMVFEMFTSYKCFSTFRTRESPTTRMQSTVVFQTILF